MWHWRGLFHSVGKIEEDGRAFEVQSEIKKKKKDRSNFLLRFFFIAQIEYNKKGYEQNLPKYKIAGSGR